MSKRYKQPLTAEELAAMPDEDIDTSDIPELAEEFWKDAHTCNRKVPAPEDLSSGSQTANRHNTSEGQGDQSAPARKQDN